MKSDTQAKERLDAATCSAPEGYVGLLFRSCFWWFVIFGLSSLIFQSYGVLPFLSGAMIAFAVSKLKQDYEDDLKLEAAFRRLRESENDEPNDPALARAQKPSD